MSWLSLAPKGNSYFCLAGRRELRSFIFFSQPCESSPAYPWICFCTDQPGLLWLPFSYLQEYFSLNNFEAGSSLVNSLSPTFFLSAWWVKCEGNRPMLWVSLWCILIVLMGGKNRKHLAWFGCDVAKEEMLFFFAGFSGILSSFFSQPIVQNFYKAKYSVEGWAGHNKPSSPGLIYLPCPPQLWPILRESSSTVNCPPTPG